jgi:hypothetical protein
MKFKKADENLLEQIIFIILNILFFAALLFFVWRSASSDSVLEEQYAKKIGLIIDSMKPGSEVTISLLKLNEIANSNKFKGNVVFVDVNNNQVNVRVGDKTGKSFSFYTKVLYAKLSSDNKLLTIVV